MASNGFSSARMALSLSGRMTSWFERDTVVIEEMSGLVLQPFHGRDDGVQRGGDPLAAFLPLEIEHGHERLGDRVRASGRAA